MNINLHEQVNFYKRKYHETVLYTPIFPMKYTKVKAILNKQYYKILHLPTGTYLYEISPNYVKSKSLKLKNSGTHEGILVESTYPTTTRYYAKFNRLAIVTSKDKFGNQLQLSTNCKFHNSEYKPEFLLPGISSKEFELIPISTKKAMEILGFNYNFFINIVDNYEYLTNANI